MPSITITDLQNAKLDVDHIAEIVTSPDATATDRLGVVKNTLAGSLAIMASFNERGAWVSGTSYAIKDIYIFESIAYVVTLSHTSSTVSADLAAGRVAIHQGATKEELSSLSNGLAASSGAALVGFLQSGTGTVARTLQSKERDAVSLYDFAGADPTGGTDSYAAFASAITYLASINGGKLILPPGTFKLMTPIVISSSNMAYMMADQGRHRLRFCDGVAHQTPHQSLPSLRQAPHQIQSAIRLGYQRLLLIAMA
jgi:hypothetical protein